MRCPDATAEQLHLSGVLGEGCAWWVSEWRAPSIADSDRGIRRFTREVAAGWSARCRGRWR